MMRLYCNFAILFLMIGCSFAHKKEVVEKNCKKNIHYFILAKECIVDNEKELRKLRTTEYNTIVLSDSLVRILASIDSSYINIMALWNTNLIAVGNSIYIYDDKSIAFMLPQKGIFMIYDPSNTHPYTCGTSNKVKYKLEKDWYYNFVCPE